MAMLEMTNRNPKTTREHLRVIKQRVDVPKGDAVAGEDVVARVELATSREVFETAGLDEMKKGRGMASRVRDMVDLLREELDAE